MRKIFTLLFILVVNTGAIFASVKIGDLYYELYSTNTAKVTTSPAGIDNNYVGLTNVVIPANVTYNNRKYTVTSIGYHAFQRCKSLKSVTISNGVQEISSDAFAACTNLQSITIPNSVTNIGASAFACCPITSITLPNGLKVISQETFFKCESLRSVYIPSSLTTIQSRAFWLSGLVSIVVPNSVTSIGNGAFSGCESLKSAKLSNNLTKIASSTFSNCSSLTSITIPNSVTCIGESAFGGCGISSITIPNSVTTIESAAFSGCDNLTSITIPNSVTDIGVEVFGRCKNLTMVTLSNKITKIEESMFDDCENLTSIVIPNSVTSIGDGAFFGCSNLTSIEIPNSITSIGEWAFNGCKSLASPLICHNHILVHLPASCSGSYIVPEEIDSIVNGAFSDCRDSLTSITISKNTRIGSLSFAEYYENSRMNYYHEDTIIYSPEIIALPPENQRFYQWSDGDSHNPRSLNIYQNPPISINAEYISNMNYINVMCDSTRGSIEGESGSFKYMTIHQYKATPNYGYHFVQWSDGNTDNPRTITIENDITISAIFAPNKYVIKDGCNAQQGNIIKAGEYDYLTECKITANPNKGYNFVQWTDGETQSTRVFTITQDTTFVAKFEISRSGSCGIGLHWEYNKETKTLTISGNGSLSSNAFFGLEAMNEMEHLIIGDGVFNILCLPLWRECNTLQTITNYASTPQFMLSNAFSSLVYSSATLFVPKGSKADYKKAKGWENFKKNKIIKE